MAHNYIVIRHGLGADRTHTHTHRKPSTAQRASPGQVGNDVTGNDLDNHHAFLNIIGWFSFFPFYLFIFYLFVYLFVSFIN